MQVLTPLPHVNEWIASTASVDRCAEGCLPIGKHSLLTERTQIIAIGTVSVRSGIAPLPGRTMEVHHGCGAKSRHHHRGIARHWRGPREGIPGPQLPHRRKLAVNQAVK